MVEQIIVDVVVEVILLHSDHIVQHREDMVPTVVRDVQVVSEATVQVDR